VRGLLVIVAFAVQILAHNQEVEESTTDLITLEDLRESLSFGEVKKRILAAKCIAVICDTVSDKTKPLEIGGHSPSRKAYHLCHVRAHGRQHYTHGPPE
jgi:hypothetical protein